MYSIRLFVICIVFVYTRGQGDTFLMIIFFKAQRITIL